MESVLIDYCENQIGKKVLKGRSFHQSNVEIFYNHWLELLHEICHWFVASDYDKSQYNLGFNDFGEQQTPHHYSREIAARLLSNKISDVVKLSENEMAYCEYLNDISELISNADYTLSEIENEADMIFNSDGVRHLINKLKNGLE
jgi:hypothetical protein